MLATVPMSRDDTAVRTREALEASGLTVLDLPQLADIDHFPDALSVAAECRAAQPHLAGGGVGGRRAGAGMSSGLDRLLGARLPGPPDAARRGPFREGAFTSPLHSERRAARVGAWLGAAFLVCFLTGLISHLIQNPPGWFSWPASPAWLYRVTQGLHVATGLAAIPLLLVKLWTVYPKLFEWPPAGSVSRAVSRLSVLVLVGACAMQLLTGLINLAEWYPWAFFFTTTHYWTGWLAIGAVAVHVGAKAPEIRRGLARRGSAGAAAGLTTTRPPTGPPSTSPPRTSRCPAGPSWSPPGSASARSR